jgi:F-type H+-transporting ATPase subunit b
MPPPPAPEGASGLPQFDLAQWPGQIVWVLIVFVALYLLLAKVFLPRIAGAIDMREDRISGEIGQSRRMRDEATARSAEAAGEIARAKAQARKHADEALAQVKAEGQARRAEEDAGLATIISEAETRIAAARDEAMAHVRSIAHDTAGAIVERLTGRKAPADELVAAANRLVGGGG